MDRQFSFKIVDTWVAALVKQSSHSSGVHGFFTLGDRQMKRSVALRILQIDLCAPGQEIIKRDIRARKRRPVKRRALLQILFIDIETGPQKERN